VNAVDYLLKPFDRDRLVASIERARQRLSSQPSALIQQLEGLIGAHEPQWLQRLVVRNGERYDFVQAEAIDWIESANNYSVLHTRAKDYVFGETLASLERRLDPARFSRVHRCHIVNVTRIVAASAIAGGVFELELRGGTRVKTGRQYGESIRRLIKGGE
jgi:two-component system, LytTR family, response regulator